MFSYTKMTPNSFQVWVQKSSLERTVRNSLCFWFHIAHVVMLYYDIYRIGRDVLLCGALVFRFNVCWREGSVWEWVYSFSLVHGPWWVTFWFTSLLFSNYWCPFINAICVLCDLLNTNQNLLMCQKALNVNYIVKFKQINYNNFDNSFDFCTWIATWSCNLTLYWLDQ